MKCVRPEASWLPPTGVGNRSTRASLFKAYACSACTPRDTHPSPATRRAGPTFWTRQPPWPGRARAWLLPGLRAHSRLGHVTDDRRDRPFCCPFTAASGVEVSPHPTPPRSGRPAPFRALAKLGTAKHSASALPSRQRWLISPGSGCRRSAASMPTCGRCSSRPMNMPHHWERTR